MSREKGFHISDETKRKMSESKRGKTFSDEHRKHLSEVQKNWWKNHPLTEEQRKARGKAISDAYRRKRNMALKDEYTLEYMNWKAVEIRKPDIKEFVRKHGKLELF